MRLQPYAAVSVLRHFTRLYRPSRHHGVFIWIAIYLDWAAQLFHAYSRFAPRKFSCGAWLTADTLWGDTQCPAWRLNGSICPGIVGYTYPKQPRFSFLSPLLLVGEVSSVHQKAALSYCTLSVRPCHTVHSSCVSLCLRSQRPSPLRRFRGLNPKPLLQRSRLSLHPSLHPSL